MSYQHQRTLTWTVAATVTVTEMLEACCTPLYAFMLAVEQL
jgi:hypothetical protein